MATYLKRKLEAELILSLSSNKAVFILGARQVGKTTMMRRLMEQVGAEQALFFDFEHPQVLQDFQQGIDNVIAMFELNRKSQSGRLYVFIDEIQYLDDFSHSIKYLVDHYADKYKLIMSGSSSMLIKHQFTESLVGRKQVFELYPLSFVEFCLFKGETKIAELISSPFDNTHPDPLRVAKTKMENLIGEYITFGGYPEVVLSDSIAAKKDILADVVSAYIIKDIKHLFRIEKMEQFNHLVLYLSYNIGKELSIQAISQEVGLHRETVKSHLSALQSAYAIFAIKPLYSNRPIEAKKMPKVYFADTGIRNSILNKFEDLSLRLDKGELFENYVHNQLLQRSEKRSEIKYWKTKRGQEVDFVVIGESGMAAYEVKFGKDKSNHFKAFVAAYPQAKCQTIRFTYQSGEGELPAYF